MESKVCAKCGKELKDYEVNYRLVDGETAEVCLICATALDYKSGNDEKNAGDVAVTADEKTDPQLSKKLTQKDIDKILIPHSESKSNQPLGKLFDSNNTIASLLKAAAVAVLCVGLIMGIVFIAFIETYGLFPLIISLAVGVIVSLLFFALSEIITLLTSINSKMK